jgi:allantoin racemase
LTVRLLVINPNTSAAMTRTILHAARDLPDPDVEIDAVAPAFGPPSVEGQVDEIVSAYWTLDAVLPVAGEYDGLVVACYGPHPVIGGLREVLEQPVVGIMEASILHALPLGERFSIVTTSPRWPPLLREGVRALGIQERCASVRSSGLSVLDLEALPKDIVRERLCGAAHQAVEQDGAEVICLGCAGMAGLDKVVAESVRVPVIDGVRAAVALVTGMVRSGAATSKHRLYRPVDERQLDGLPRGIASAYRPDD